MVLSNDRSADEVQRVNEQLEQRHYEFRSNCNDGDGAAQTSAIDTFWIVFMDEWMAHVSVLRLWFG